jgi:carbamoyl-phosphate synthase large subunit
MKSTGEVMGIDKDFGLAFAKAQAAAGSALPLKGNVFISVDENNKIKARQVAKELSDLGFSIMATKGTAEFFQNEGISVEEVNKYSDGRRPNIVDKITNNEIQLVINTPYGKTPRSDGYYIRTAAVAYGIPCITTMAGAIAAVKGIRALLENEVTVKTLQEYHNLGSRK